MLIKLPVMRVFNDQLVLFDQFEISPQRSEAQKMNEKNLTRGKFNGYMSPKTKSKVKKYLSTWIEAGTTIAKSNHRAKLDKIPYFTFVTLTLPAKQQHSDNEIKRKCLTPYIATLQRKYDVWHYFWRAESQLNGNIHFHLIIDSKIKWRDIRNEWNKCINKLGYIERFQAKYNHQDPNSTDIHSLRNINSPASYVIKYCTKSDGYRRIKGRIHGCSDGLRNLTPYETVIGASELDFLRKVAKDKSSKVYDCEDFKIIKCSVKQMMLKYWPEIRKEILKYQVSVAHNLYTVELSPEIQLITAKQERKKLVQLKLFSSSPSY